MKKRSDTLNDRIGTVGYNFYGSRMIVEKYNTCDDILVKFMDSNFSVHASWYNFKKGNIKNPYDKTLYGIGYIGIGKHKTSIKGKQNHIYKTWSGMFQRCYEVNYQNKQPKYKGCTVSEEWHCFQNFAQWYDENYYKIDGEVMCLDKDILIKGNKVYSPETCVFVPIRINSLFVKKDSSRGEFPIGVSVSKNKFVARCNNGTGRAIDLGHFNSPMEAFDTYKFHKEKIIKQVAEEYKNKIPRKLYDSMINYKVEIDD